MIVKAPVEPTEEMIDAPRMLLAYADTNGRTLQGAREHLRLCGDSIECWPDWAKKESGHITKGALAILVYTMMLNVAPKIE